MEFKHIPVLLDEVIEGLNINPNGIYVDCTVGGAGHSTEICNRLKNGRLLGLDRDPDAVAVAKERLEKYNAKVFNANYDRISEILALENIEKVDGILMDLGVSSYQLDNPERGFSYNDEDAPLDMRMSKSGMSAADFLNTAPEDEISKILCVYGEEKYSRSIAKKIVEIRRISPFKKTGDFEKAIREAVPAKYIRQKNPCKKSFQAVRIYINDEFGHLENGLEECFKSLKTGGRLCVISFHSLEDRIVRHKFSEWQRGCICPPDFPVCVCGRKPMGKVLSKSGIKADDAEISENRRSRSAILRIIERSDEKYRTPDENKAR